jgi:hypothetical protein
MEAESSDLSHQRWLCQNSYFARGKNKGQSAILKHRGLKSQVYETYGVKSAILKHRGSKSQVSET